MADGFLDYVGLARFKEKLLGVVDDKVSNASAGVVSSGQGYRALLDGTIQQWGKALIANDSGTRVVFPVAFPHAVETVTCEPIDLEVPHKAVPDGLGAVTITHSGNGGVEMYWFAVGK